MRKKEKKHMQIVEVTKDNFEQEVLGAKVPVVIASWLPLT